MYAKYMKRLLDILLSLTILVVLSPLLLVLCILVRSKLGSPIFFEQERPGLHEKIFTMYKFRTMTDKRDAEGNLLPDKDRLTKFGKLLRATSLDELPEFSRDSLEVLRQPLEDGKVTVSRVHGTASYPCRFMLVAAMNPCKCGWRGHPSGKCTCSDKEVEKYVQKISGPLLDRIDLHVNVPSVEYEAMRRKSKPESSAQVKERVDAARAIQSRRFEGTGIPCNAQMTPPMVGRFCELDSRCDALMKSAFERMGLTARSHDRVLRVARTIADLDGAEHIGVEHLSEAIQYRNTDILKG